MSNPVARYLEGHANLETRPLVCPDTGRVEQVVVVPVLAESSSLPETLEHLAANPREELDRTLVVVVVNNRAAPAAREEDIADNAATLDMLKEAFRGRGALHFEGLRLGYIDASSATNELPEKDGVGLARKLGLDWGVEILRGNDANSQLLLNLDADVWVEPDYLQALRTHFSCEGAWAGAVEYAHRPEGPPEQQTALAAYELFLRYHAAALAWAQSPYAFHTIGSTIACTVEAYVAVTGMNRRAAGEDFYFLDKLAKTGRVDLIDSTTVHPAGRVSHRAPFGTGRHLGDALSPEGGLATGYHWHCYEVLKAWLALVHANPRMDAPSLVAAAADIDAELAVFVDESGFARVWPRLQKNARDDTALFAQFHRWFDGLKTLRLIHHLRDHGYPNRPIEECARGLATRTGDS